MARSFYTVNGHLSTADQHFGTGGGAYSPEQAAAQLAYMQANPIPGLVSSSMSMFGLQIKTTPGLAVGDLNIADQKQRPANPGVRDVSVSTYGNTIPISLGRRRMFGNIIDSTALMPRMVGTSTYTIDYEIPYLDNDSGSECGSVIQGGSSAQDNCGDDPCSTRTTPCVTAFEWSCDGIGGADGGARGTYRDEGTQWRFFVERSDDNFPLAVGEYTFSKDDVPSIEDYVTELCEAPSGEFDCVNASGVWYDEVFEWRLVIETAGESFCSTGEVVISKDEAPTIGDAIAIVCEECDEPPIPEGATILAALAPETTSLIGYSLNGGTGIAPYGSIISESDEVGPGWVLLAIRSEGVQGNFTLNIAGDVVDGINGSGLYINGVRITTIEDNSAENKDLVYTSTTAQGTKFDVSFSYLFTFAEGEEYNIQIGP